MKKNILSILLLIFLSGSAISQSGWIQVNIPSNKPIYSTDFCNRDTGYIGTDSGLIYKTMTGGLNWYSINLNTRYSVWKINFINAFTGYVLIGPGLYKSSTAGLTWTQLSIPFSVFSDDMYFLNPNTGYLANSRNLLRTNNGGINWDTIGVEYVISPMILQFNGVYFKDENTGFAVGDEQVPNAYMRNVIWKTQNAGLNWARVYDESGCEFSCISFIDNLTGYCVGGCSYMSKTTNGGNNWYPVSRIAGEYPNLHSISILTNNKVFVCGGYGFYETTSGGSNWISISLPLGYYYSVSFPDSSVGYVAGSSGRLFKTTTGGNPIGVNQTSSEIPLEYSLSQNYPNPFNPTTKIKFDIPAVGNGRDRSVKLVVCDILGREVATLVNEQLKPGTYEADWDASNFASGIYFYSLQTNEFTQTKKMVLMK